MAPAWTPRRVAAELLPCAQARLAAARERIGELCSAITGATGGERASAGLDSNWTAAEEDLARLGWCLGALAGALDADLLLARAEPRGLRWLLELAESKLAERGQHLEPPAGDAELLPNAAGSWREALAVAGAVLAAAAAAPAGAAVRVPRLSGEALPAHSAAARVFPVRT